MIASASIKLKNTSVSLSHLPDPRRQAIKGNVLLALHNKEDSDTVAGYLKDTYTLFTARSESGVMKIIETYSIHLIIASMELSDTNGNKLCITLKSSGCYSHIPVILIIAEDVIQSRFKSLEAGADAYIEKPLSCEFMKAQVNNVMRNRARIKEYFAHTLFAHIDMTTGSKTSEVFVNRLNQHIADNLPNRYFDVEGLAKHMNMSRPTLYRKVKCISALTPNELINAARLKKAAELMITTDHKIFEIAKMVGFNSLSNFGKAFVKQFNVTPTLYRQSKKSITSPDRIISTKIQ